MKALCISHFFKKAGLLCISMMLASGMHAQIDFDVSAPPSIYLQIARQPDINESSSPIYLKEQKQVSRKEESSVYVRKSVVKDTITLRTWYSNNDKEVLVYQFISKAGQLFLKEMKFYSLSGTLQGSGYNLHSERGIMMIRDKFTADVYLYKAGKKQEGVYVYEGNSDGLLRIRGMYKNQLSYGYWDQKGQEVIPIQYLKIVKEKELFLATNENNKIGVITRSAKQVIPFLYDKIYVRNKLFEVQIGESSPDWKFGLYTRSGKQVIPVGRKFLLDFDQSTLSYAQGENGKYGYINDEGELILPNSYTSARPFRDGLAAVGNDAGKLGFINLKGDLVIPYKYSLANDFSNGKSFVGENKKPYYIDTEGNKIK